VPAMINTNCVTESIAVGARFGAGGMRLIDAA
jgi:hypothetical protein